MPKKLSAKHQELIPYLYYRDPAGAVEFLSKAFGFEVRGVHKDDGGRVMHGELGAGRSAVMLGPAHPDQGFASPSELPARHAGVWCYVDDADAHCAKARAAGATIVREPTDQFYGVREYTARDVEGQEWFFATPLPSATPARKPKPAQQAKVRGARSSKGPGARSGKGLGARGKHRSLVPRSEPQASEAARRAAAKPKRKPARRSRAGRRR